MININDIYKSTSGTTHYVRVVDRRREFFKNEPLANTAPIYQYGLQRQQEDTFIDDPNYEIFTMYEGNFLESYTKVSQ